MTTMAGLGASTAAGGRCGTPTTPEGRTARATANGVDRYGTSLALELIPYFTGAASARWRACTSSRRARHPGTSSRSRSCAESPSNPIQSLTFGNIDSDFDRGITHMRMLGVKYFMAIAPKTKEMAAAHPADLQLVAQTDEHQRQAPAGWDIYLVKNPDGSDVQLVEAAPVPAGRARRGRGRPLGARVAKTAGSSTAASSTAWSSRTGPPSGPGPAPPISWRHPQDAACPGDGEQHHHRRRLGALRRLRSPASRSW